MTFCSWVLRFCGGLVLCLVLATPARSEDQPDWDLREFAQLPRSQRNRVLAEDLPAEIAAHVLTIVQAGVRGCACLPRRLRWVWALPRPSDKAHPSLVVAFDDRPRAHDQILMYERMVLVSFQEGKYSAKGVLTLNRPLANADAALNVSMLPRRDFDQDGQLDIGVRFSETWQQKTQCGRVLFQSSAVVPVYEDTPCASEGDAD